MDGMEGKVRTRTDLTSTNKHKLVLKGQDQIKIKKTTPKFNHLLNHLNPFEQVNLS